MHNEIPFWLDDITKKMKDTHIKNSSSDSSNHEIRKPSNYKSENSNKLDWGDSPAQTGITNDFLSDLLPHYVTPRHRRMNNIIDNDFSDVIIGRISKKSKTIPSKVQKRNSRKEKDNDFVIPELPRGRLLEIKIYSNWGDKFLVGLNGIELFDVDGEIVDVEKIWSDSDTGDCTKHGRAESIVDGVVRTKDDRHIWSAPAPGDAPIALSILLAKCTTLALLRIWNYNKSRIYSTRGVRLIQMKLDDQVVFQGEIAKSSGEMKGLLPTFGDDPSILERVLLNDKHFQSLLRENDPAKDYCSLVEKRPPTANDASHMSPPILEVSTAECDTKYVAKAMKLSLMSNWGHKHIIGLTGIEVLNYNKPVKVHRAFAYTAYISDDTMEEGGGLIDCRNLFNGNNITTDFNDMWCTNFSPGTKFCHIVVEFNEPTEISSIRIWNYNANLEFSYIGVKHVRFHLDGRPLHYRPLLLRRAPGETCYDFVQQLDLAAIDHGLEDASDTESFIMDCLGYGSGVNFGAPTGFVLQLSIFSTWGDPYYVGLTGVELYDPHGNIIPVNETNVCAHPASVNVLGGRGAEGARGGERDARTPSRLVDGRNALARDAAHSWLAPILPRTLNRQWPLRYTHTLY
ncbi:unnamed protein product, partial [Iphiclides podalirius]